METPRPQTPWLNEGELLLHIGVHKTGTTALQGAFANSRSGMRSQGVAYPGGLVSHYFASLAVVGQRRGWQKGGQRLPMTSWTDLVDEVARSSGKVVISSEAFCEAPTDVAERIVADLGGSRVKVVVTLRPLEQLIPSTWQQYIKAGASVRYDDWLADTMRGPGQLKQVTPSFWKRNDHAALIERWCSIVGPERVAVVVVDTSDRNGVYRSFESLIGLTEGTLVPNPKAPSNRSLSVPEVELIRSLNEKLDKKLDWGDYNRLVRQGGIIDLVEKRTPGADEPRLTVPGWAVERSREFGREAVTRLRASGAHIVGDLELMAPTTPPGADIASTATEIPVDAAVLVLQGVLGRALSKKGKKAAATAANKPKKATTPAAPPSAWQRAVRKARRSAGRVKRRVMS